MRDSDTTGDPKSTDPDAKIRQLYVQRKASGGFLLVTVTGSAQPAARFTLIDTLGTEWYSAMR